MKKYVALELDVIHVDDDVIRTSQAGKAEGTLSDFQEAENKGTFY